MVILQWLCLFLEIAGGERRRDTRAGQIFDVVLLWVIGLSVLTLVLESVDSIRAVHGTFFLTLEWIFTGLFTLPTVRRALYQPAYRSYI